MMALRDWTLRTHLATLLMATLVPLTGLTAFWVLRAVREERAQLQQEVQGTAELIASQAAQSVAGAQERLAVLARLPAVRAGNRQELDKLFRNILADAPHLQNLGLVAPDGEVVASGVPLPPGRPVSLGDREWLQRVVRWAEPATGGFQVGRITGNPDVILAHPVLDEQERLTAVLFVALDLVHVSRTVGWAYPDVPLLWAIVDEQGLVLLQSGPETMSGKPLALLPGMLRGETVVPGTRWHSVVLMPEGMATARVRQAFLHTGLPAALIILVAAGVGFWMARSTWRPLRALTVAVRRVGTGDPTVRIPVETGGEIGELATAFAETLAAVDRGRKELTALLQANRAIVSSLDLEQSLQSIVRTAANIAGAPVVRLFMLDEDAQVLRSRVGIGLPPEEERNIVVRVGESFSGQVMTTGKPLSVPDTRGDPRLRHPSFTTQYGIVSYLGLPVKMGDRVIGVLVINTGAPRTYSEEEIAFLSAFADQAAIAIENAQLHDTTVRRAEQLARRTQHLEALRAVTAEITQELALDTLLGLIVRRAVELTGTASGTIYLWDEAAEILVPRVWEGLGEWMHDVRFRLGEGVPGTVAQRREGMIVNEYHASPYARPVFSEHTRITGVAAEPLLFRDRLVGAISLNREEGGRPFSAEDQQLLVLFAAQATVAIENARLYAGEQERRKQLETVRAVTEEITRELDLTTVLELITRRAVDLVGGSGGMLRLWDEEAGLLTPQSWVGLNQQAAAISLHLGEGVAGAAAERRQGLIENDFRHSPYATPALLECTTHTAVLAEPLVYHDRLVGVINLNRDQEGRPFVEEDRQLLTLFADQAAVAIENARLYAAEQERRNQLEAVRAVNEEITRELDLQTLLGLILRYTQELTQATSITINLWDEEAQVLVPQTWFGFDTWRGELPLRLGEGVAGTVAKRREGLIVNDFRTSPYALPIFLERTTYTAAMAEPLLYRDRLIGVLAVGREQTGQPFTEKDRELLALFAAQAAIAIENARLHETTVRRAQELGTLNELTRTLTSVMDPRAVPKAVLTAVQSMIPDAACRLFDRVSGEGETEVFRLVASVGLGEAGSRLGLQLACGEGLVGIAAATRQPVVSADITHDPRFQDKEWAVTEDLTSCIALPLIFRDRTTGALVIFTHTSHDFTGEEVGLLQAFAGQATIALESARLYRDALEKSERLEGLTRTSATIAGTLRLEEVLDAIVEEAAKLLRMEGAGFRLVEGDRLVVGSKCGVAHNVMLSPSIRIGESVTGLVAQQGRPIMIRDLRDNDQHLSEHRAAAVTHGVAAYLGVPVRCRDRIIGVLNVYGKEPQTFSEAEVRLLTVFADHAAIAIENARLYEATQKELADQSRAEEALKKSEEHARHLAQESATMAEIGRIISSTLNVDEVYDSFATEVKKLIPFDRIVINSINVEKNLVRNLYISGENLQDRNTSDVYPLQGSGNAEMVHTKASLLIQTEDFRAYQDRFPRLVSTFQAGFRSILNVPLFAKGQVVGGLLLRSRQPNAYTERDVRLAERIGSQIAGTIANVQLYLENLRLYDTIRQHAADLEVRVRDRTAELEEALRVKVEFLAKMSHELRTPLNHVIGFSELLQQEVGGALSPKQATYVDRIHNGGKRLLQLISDILDITQVDAGKSRLHLEPVIVASLIEEILGPVQVLMTQKRLKVTTALDPWLPFIVADRFKLVQVLHNLVGNAVKFTPDGGTINIVSRRIGGAAARKSDEENRPAPPDDYAEVIVEDSGIGIRAEDLETIFGPFYQVNGSENRAYGGAGLGLALVRKLVELHGGRVWAESAGPKMGARFIVRLPRLEAPQAKRILLVEDEPLLRIPMAAALENAGFTVTHAATGAEALAAMEATPPDLMILDILLPDLNGWELLRRVREAEEVRTLPVLVVTALETVNAEQAMARGADEFLTKPISARVLVDTAARLLGQVVREVTPVRLSAAARMDSRNNATGTAERGQERPGDTGGRKE
jgi:GAF domain-containing protein/DNA-binding NarL/FixJ family response regulator